MKQCIRTLFLLLAGFPGPGLGESMKQNMPTVKTMSMQADFEVPGVGLEPTQPQWPRDFKSLVSTDSTIRAANALQR